MFYSSSLPHHPPPPLFVPLAVCVFSQLYLDLRFLVTSVFLYRYVCCSWVGKPLCLKMTNCNKSSIPPWHWLVFMLLNSCIYFQWRFRRLVDPKITILSTKLFGAHWLKIVICEWQKKVKQVWHHMRPSELWPFSFLGKLPIQSITLVQNMQTWN